MLFVASSISLCSITNSVKVGDDTKMRCVCPGEDSDDDVFGNVAKKQPKQIYDRDDDVVDFEHHARGILEPAVEQPHPLDTHEMIGSTKSLIPLSPTSCSGEQHFVEDEFEKADSCDVPEKPLVIL